MNIKPTNNIIDETAKYFFSKVLMTGECGYLETEKTEDMEGLTIFENTYKIIIFYTMKEPKSKLIIQMTKEEYDAWKIKQKDIMRVR